ncbi:hypothetical protein PAXRUDRAFT_32843 [Paxillus rubicundulus Ve08.2h10]|uniref:Uncharacterized protein n=1 Tax=Paxillus rubicundulus Ve08.2h10 TaxID=930991 RepID=A0A0D0E3U7_9AGAM|nr:hypothetical protein PAXRUDRAFT_32843 [Paxillus rubicundulus Ve08.2h10]
MDGTLSAATVLQLIQVVMQVSAALSIKNAQLSCKKFIKHISIIIGTATSAKDILISSWSSHSLGYNGHLAQCTKEFDGLLNFAKLMLSLTERKIKAVIQTFNQHKVVSIKEMRETHDDLEALTRTVNNGMLSVKASQDKSKTDVLDGVKHEVMLRQCLKQTCSWFFHVQKLLGWRLTLTEFIGVVVIKELSRLLSYTIGETFAYFYSDFWIPW